VVVTFDDFSRSLSGAAPASSLALPLVGLWWAAKGDWDRAHKIVQDDPSAEAAWVHAYLHRVEGDQSNAGYWYRRAGKPIANGSLETEWESIASTLTASAETR
jgi:hypothetical protein